MNKRMLFSLFASLWLNVTFFLGSVSANYFVATNPNRQTQWVNGQVNTITWEKGLMDTMNGFDIEMARISATGLILVAKNVPSKPGGLHILLENVPAGDDYVMIFLNSTHGVLYNTSPRFSILESGATPTVAQTPVKIKNDNKAATVTVTSGPNPTAFFATTFPALPWSSAPPPLLAGGPLGGVLGMAVACVAGALWTLL